MFGDFMIKPYDYSYLKSTLDSSRLSTYMATAIALGCVGGLVANRVTARDIGFLMTGMGMGATIAAKSSSKVAQDTKLILNDYEDLSAQARTNIAFTELQVVPVEIPEYNWATLVNSKYSCGIMGDRGVSIKVASWLSSQSVGKSYFVSELSEEIRVSQTLGLGKETKGSLLDIVNQRVLPSYPHLLNTLDANLLARRSNPNLREPLIFVLDNPPHLPDIRQAAEMGITYIVLGKLAPNWTDILVGAQALYYLSEQPDTEYIKQVRLRFLKSPPELLVRGQYARLPEL